MKIALLIFFGGGLGSLARFFLGKWVNTFHMSIFPYGTLVVNIVACFILGLIVGLADGRGAMSGDSKVFWAIGFCGGFSTFSTFGLEVAQLFETPAVGTGVIYIVGSVLLCWGAIVLGMWLGR